VPRISRAQIPNAHSTRYNLAEFIFDWSNTLSDAHEHKSHSHHPASHFRINTYRVQDATVVECHGKLTSEHAPQLRTEVRNLLPAEKRIIIDMKEVHHMDSSGLGALATLYVSCRTRGSKLELINLNQATRSLLSMTNLLSLFEEAGRYGGKLP
jgi:anti-sigma B factor antagonist